MTAAVYVGQIDNDLLGSFRTRRSWHIYKMLLDNQTGVYQIVVCKQREVLCSSNLDTTFNF